MQVVFCNFGNESIALLQWIHAKNLKDITVIHVNTGWQAQIWGHRVEASANFARDIGFDVIELSPKLNFAALVEERQELPSLQFRWCATLLKALPLLTWLEKNDPSLNATIILPQRRGLNPTISDLPEFIESSEHFNERKVWHPLFGHSLDEVKKLVAKTPLAWLPHASLECSPCIANSKNDKNLTAVDKNKAQQLAATINCNDFNYAPTAISYYDNLYATCGNSFACGL